MIRKLCRHLTAGDKVLFRDSDSGEVTDSFTVITKITSPDAPSVVVWDDQRGTHRFGVDEAVEVAQYR